MNRNSKPSRNDFVAPASPERTTAHSSGSAKRWRKSRRSAAVSAGSKEKTTTRKGASAFASACLRNTAVIGQVPVQRVKTGRSSLGAPAPMTRSSRLASRSSSTARAGRAAGLLAGSSAASSSEAKLAGDEAVLAIEDLEERRQVGDEDGDDPRDDPGAEVAHRRHLLVVVRRCLRERERGGALFGPRGQQRPRQRVEEEQHREPHDAAAHHAHALARDPVGTEC